ncbi:hypothetical protein PVAP13_1NG047608 [Panicum virgatum]|uniref:Uncharacterized protein n=1 Tax=Panicum virgatum TaxID=38727 RepID=A0A8T0WY51_PANVG|nr:hypothetical protein PVAP13_1NG047608 [Panicum virgatum]
MGRDCRSTLIGSMSRSRGRRCAAGAHGFAGDNAGDGPRRTPPPAPALDFPPGCADFLSSSLDSPPGRAISGAGAQGSARYRQEAEEQQQVIASRVRGKKRFVPI